MPRYIDADERKQHIASFAGMFTDELGFAVSIEAVLEALDSAPAADVVEVVRCKDCRYWEEIGIDPITDYTFGYCRHYQWQDEENSRETNGQDFCSYGERKT